MATFNLSDYVQVNERIEKFYERYPSGSIQTELISLDDKQVIFKAFAYRNIEDTKPSTGYAMEREGSNFINKTSHVENCETSAVGRALAMMGFEIKKSIASFEEVGNAKLNQTPQTEDDKVTLQYLKKLFATTREKGMTKDDSQAILCRYGYKSSKDILKKDFDKIIKEIQLFKVV